MSSPSTNTLNTTYIVLGHDVTARLDQRLDQKVHALSIALPRRVHQGRTIRLGGGRRVAQHRRVSRKSESVGGLGRG